MPALHLVAALLFLGQAQPQAPRAGGLTGLKPLVQTDPKVLTFEANVLSAINAARAKKHAEPVAMDEKLRLFARHHAELAATGDPQAQHAENDIVAQNIGGIGHRSQYSYGVDANQVLANMNHDAGATVLYTGDFMRAGIGAFYVPDDKQPFFQVMVLLVADADPMGGKPGLMPAQTDPVMDDASDKLQACYNTALKKNPNIQGDVLLRVVIKEGGAVESVAVAQSLGDLQLDSCLQGVVRGLSFPAPYKGKAVTLNHPMRFTRPQSDRKLGRLPPKQIQAVFAAAAADFRACYLPRQKINAKLAGTITLAGVIKGDGTMKSVDALHDELDDTALRVCVLGRAAKLVFPAPEFGGEVDLTYPLRFGL